MNQFEANAEEADQWHYIKRKLRVGEVLSREDRSKLIALLEISTRDSIPCDRAVENYRNHYKQLLTTDLEAVGTLKELSDKIEDFERKFIEPFRRCFKHHSA